MFACLNNTCGLHIYITLTGSHVNDIFDIIKLLKFTRKATIYKSSLLYSPDQGNGLVPGRTWYHESWCCYVWNYPATHKPIYINMLGVWQIWALSLIAKVCVYLHYLERITFLPNFHMLSDIISQFKIQDVWVIYYQNTCDPSFDIFLQPTLVFSIIK